jgi:23S rRNA (adenine1618-N6)-methyltransferase
VSKFDKKGNDSLVKFHKRNPHQGNYDFDRLKELLPALSVFVVPNKHGNESIDFSDPKAVRSLNKALLIQHYQVTHWDIPDDYLCPPIPGRADYIHHIADVLGGNNFGTTPLGKNITCLDIGVGANCIYPIIGAQTFGWSFIGSDIDEVALENAEKIKDNNPFLSDSLRLVHQPEIRDVFYGVITKEDRIDVTICNPPFHASETAAISGTKRKIMNLTKKKKDEVTLNFGGKSNELWCVGGEKQFIKDMVRQSKNFAESCFWFSSLVSKKDHVPVILDALKQAGAFDIRAINMGQGNKTSRIVAWTFLNLEQQKEWRTNHWS